MADPVGVKDHIVNAAIAAKRRVDGWSNVLLGLGTKAKDARLSSDIFWRRMAEVDIEHLYAGDAMAAKVVDLPVEEATNKGYQIIGLKPDVLKALREKLDSLSFDQAIIESARKARLYGGAAILKVYNDELKLERELNPELPKPPLKSLIVLQRFELPAYYEDVQKDLLSPQFNYPVYYTFVGRDTGAAYTNVKIHRSRLITFQGAWLPDRLRVSNNYWGDTVLSKTYDAIRNYAFAHDSVNAALKDMSVAVFKMKNLAEQIQSDCDDRIIKRLEIVNMTKSIARAVVMDAEGEDFDYKVRNLTGANDLVEKAESRLAADTGIPRTVLLGESPTGGLGQSGDHQAENWYDFLEAFQTHKLKPAMLQIIWEVAEELGIDPEKVDVEFNPLWQMSAKEEAETRAKTAETDKTYIDYGVLDASEIRASRFGKDKYSAETEIDPSINAEDLKVDPKTPAETLDPNDK